MLRNDKRLRIQRAILSWYRKHGRQLPWRKTKDPYRILVSEVMLQQTQVNRVLEKYPEFLRRFPSIGVLAKAPKRDVVMAWSGMGYNNRAVRLHALAQQVARHHQGSLPQSCETLLALPGIGKYTAHAVLSSAFGRRRAVVDTNVRRVLSRLLWEMPSTSGRMDERSAWSAAETLLPKRSFYKWNQALMDLGATLCTARAPRCSACPAVKYCASATSMKDRGRRKRRTEPAFRGVPNRIYRGRIVEMLRRSNGRKHTSVTRIETGLFGRNGRPSKLWLAELLRSLEKDGLVALRLGTGMKRTTVSLA